MKAMRATKTKTVTCPPLQDGALVLKVPGMSELPVKITIPQTLDISQSSLCFKLLKYFLRFGTWGEAFPISFQSSFPLLECTLASLDWWTTTKIPKLERNPTEVHSVHCHLQDRFIFEPSPSLTFISTQNYDFNLQTDTSWPKAWVWTRYRNGLRTTFIRIVLIDDVQKKIDGHSDVEDEINPFCNSTASILVAACQWWNIGHHMHGEHASGSTRLLQTRCWMSLILPPYPWKASQLQQYPHQLRGSPHLYSEPWHISGHY